MKNQLVMLIVSLLFASSIMTGVGMAVGGGSQRAQLDTIQAVLKNAGFDPGPIDGVWGPQTQAALRQYQAAQGLSVTGQLDNATRSSLMPGQASITSPRPCPGSRPDCPPKPHPDPQEALKAVKQAKELKKAMQDPRKELEKAITGARPVVVPPLMVAPPFVAPKPIELPSPVVVSPPAMMPKSSDSSPIVKPYGGSGMTGTPRPSGGGGGGLSGGWR